MSGVEDLKEKLDSLVADIGTSSEVPETDHQPERVTGEGQVTPARSGLRFARAGSLIALGFVLAALSWYSDNALLTLRAALNSTSGWGESFNYLDVTQSTPAPLWGALWGMVGSATGEWLLTMTVLSVACAVAAFAVIVYAAKTVPQVLFAFATLLLCGWVMEYSVSGSEVPLSLLCVGVFYLLATQTLRGAGERTIALFGLVGTAAFVVNPVLALIVIPALVYVAAVRRKQKDELALLIVAFIVPVGIYVLWSTLVFSSPLPHPTMAALRSLGDVDFLVDGAHYLWFSAVKSPISAFVVTAGTAYVAIKGGALPRLLVAGSLLTLALVAFTGGNNNLGELTAVPTYTVLLVVVATAATTSHHRVVRMVSVAAFIGCAALTFWQAPPAGILGERSPRWDSETTAGYVDTRNESVAQGRSVLEMVLGTTRAFPQVQPLQTVSTIEDIFAENNGVALRDIARAATEWPSRQTGDDMPPSGVASACANLGVYAIMTGPQNYWVDTCGRTDPFVAEQPIISSVGGLRERDVPEEYGGATQRSETARDVVATTEKREQR